MFNKYPQINLNKHAKNLVCDFNEKILTKQVNLESYPCICCGITNPKILFTNDSHGILHDTVMCNICGMIYADPRMTEADQNSFYHNELYRKIYDSHGEFSNHIEKARAKIEAARSITVQNFDNNRWNAFSFFNFINQYLNIYNLNTICEIGAGSGANLIPFKNLNKKCIGIEFSHSLISNAADYGLNISFNSLKQIDEKIDLFLMIHVLEHLHDPITYLKLIASRGPAYVLIEVPGIVDKFGDSIQNAHNFTFSKNTLLKICSTAGLECVVVEHFKNNNWIIGLFRVNKIIEKKYKYDEKEEIRKIKRIIFNLRIKNLISLNMKKLINRMIKSLNH